jgi:hypothetical protein
MPASVQNAVVPVVSGNPIVLPASLCKAFAETRAFDCRVNEYQDGTTERQALVAGPRRSWKMTKRLSPASRATLKAFWQAYPADAFYFYNPFEPLSGRPVGSNYDATGASFTGRYTVVFTGNWDEQLSFPRSEVSIGLLEVA